MRKSYSGWYTLILVFILVFGYGIITPAQSTESSVMSLPEFIKTLGLSKEKMEQTLKLTRDFLTQLQDANMGLTKLMTPPPSGFQPDPKAKEKLLQLKQKFGVQMSKYHSDLEKLIGAAKALRIAEKIHLIIPQVLIEGLKMPGINPKIKTTPSASPTPTPNTGKGGVNVNTTLTGFTSSGTNILAATNSTNTVTPIVSPTTAQTGNAPQELPLGSPVSNTTSSSGSTDTTGPSSNLDLQIVGNSSSASGHDHGSGNGMNGMDSMMSMMGGMMGNMGNMSNTNNNQAGSGMDLINRQLVLQLLANNAAIIQMLATLSYQAGNESLPLLLQPIYQLLANQASLLQMLYSNFNSATISGQSGTGNSGSGGMGMM